MDLCRISDFPFIIMGYLDNWLKSDRFRYKKEERYFIYFAYNFYSKNRTADNHSKSYRFS